MNYKATIITNTVKLEFSAESKGRLITRLFKEVKKINKDEVITLSTRIKSKIDGHDCYTPCYPCELISEDFTKDELLEKLLDYFNSIIEQDVNK